MKLYVAILFTVGCSGNFAGDSAKFSDNNSDPTAPTGSVDSPSGDSDGSEDGENTSDGEDDSSDGDGGSNDGGTDDDTVDIQLDGSEALENPFDIDGSEIKYKALCSDSKNVQTKKKKIVFNPRKSLECDKFANNTTKKNLGAPWDGGIHGYGVQSELSFSASGKLVICGFSIKSETNKFDHDDLAILTMSSRSAKSDVNFGQVFLAGDLSVKNKERLFENDTEIFKWEKLDGQKASTKISSCLTGSNCQFPVHGQGPQPIKIDIDSSKLYAASKALGTLNKMYLNLFVTTDDNNDPADNSLGDCMHSGMTLNTEFKYIVVK